MFFTWRNKRTQPGNNLSLLCSITSTSAWLTSHSSSVIWTVFSSMYHVYCIMNNFLMAFIFSAWNKLDTFHLFFGRYITCTQRIMIKSFFPSISCNTIKGLKYRSEVEKGMSPEILILCLRAHMGRPIITINEPVDNMAQAVMILMRGKDITRAIGRGGPWKWSLFWALKLFKRQRVRFGP